MPNEAAHAVETATENSAGGKSEPSVATPCPQDRDRRRHPRRPVAKPCKVFAPGLNRYLAGESENLSAGGALLEIDGGAGLGIGDELNLAIGWSASPIVSSDSLRRGQVVRVSAVDASRRAVAVAFDHMA